MIRKQKVKRLAAVFCALVVSLCSAVYGGREQMFAQTADVSIRQSVDVARCKSGDTVTLSVYMDGSAVNISEMSGYLEYDDALFFADSPSLVTVGSATNMSLEAGRFSMRYPAGVVVSDKGLLFQVKFRVRGTVSVGKTTICVTELEMKTASGNKKITNHAPSSIEILASANPSAEDSDSGNGDWADGGMEDWDEYWEEDTEAWEEGGNWEDQEETKKPETGGTKEETKKPETGGTKEETKKPETGGTKEEVKKPETGGTKEETKKPETGGTKEETKKPETGGTKEETKKPETGGTKEEVKKPANTSAGQKPVSTAAASSGKKPYKTGRGEADFLIIGGGVLLVGMIALLARRKLGE